MEPGVGLSGIGLTCTQPRPRCVELLGQQVGTPGVVVHVLDQRVLDGDPAARLVEVVVGGVERLVDLPAGVDRDELVAELVVGSVQGERERDRDVLVGELADRGDEADRGDGDVRGRSCRGPRVRGRHDGARRA